MGDFLFGIFVTIAVFVSVQLFKTSEVETRLNRYSMKLGLKVSQVSLEDAGKLERTLKEWFPEIELLSVEVVPDSTTK